MNEAEIRDLIASAAISYVRTGADEMLEQIREFTRVLDSRPSVVYKISDHAIKRFCERSGCQSRERARKKIMRMLDQAERVELKERYKLASYFNHGAKQTEETLFLRYHNWIFPVCKNTVLTCHNGEAGRWRKLEAQ